MERPIYFTSMEKAQAHYESLHLPRPDISARPPQPCKVVCEGKEYDGAVIYVRSWSLD